MTTARASHAASPDEFGPEPQTAPIKAILGSPIYTKDGRCLGTVKEAGPHCFRVDARFAFDYWLSMRAVAAIGEDSVRLGVEKREVGDYLVDIDCPEDFEDLEPVVEHRPTVEVSAGASLPGVA